MKQNKASAEAAPAYNVRQRLEYLRAELRAERISYGELHELQCLAGHIAADDIELLQAAGVPEDAPARSGQHTPGPWSIVDGQEVHAKTVAEDTLVACCHAGHEPERRANARLIAAAPELLGALRQIEAMLTQPVQFTGIRNGASSDVLRADCKVAAEVARAAIAKAEGRAE